MGLFDRHAGLLEAYRDVRTTGADPFQIRMERVLSPTEAVMTSIMCSSCCGVWAAQTEHRSSDTPLGVAGGTATLT